jgi:hypothetical protein
MEIDMDFSFVVVFVRVCTQTMHYSPTVHKNSIYFLNKNIYKRKTSKIIIFNTRHIAEKDYITPVKRGKKFALTMATLQSKGKYLKKQGKGNNSKAANDIADEKVNQLYSAEKSSNHRPSTLV